MKNIRAIAGFLAIIASPIAFASFPADSIVYDYDGLGNSPLALELKKLSNNWSPRGGPIKIRDFLATFRSASPAGADIRTIFEGAGLECAAPPATLCSYAGVYTYELRKSGGRVLRTARRMDVTVNFETEPWDVKASAQFIYGAPFHSE